MTKVSILGQEPTEKKELKKIEFIKGIDKHIDSVDFFEPCHLPSFYNEIQVVKRYKPEVFDFFICHSNMGHVHTYLGHFNDGIV